VEINLGLYSSVVPICQLPVALLAHAARTPPRIPRRSACLAVSCAPPPTGLSALREPCLPVRSMAAPPTTPHRARRRRFLALAPAPTLGTAGSRPALLCAAAPGVPEVDDGHELQHKAVVEGPPCSRVLAQ
jgi:hypothetical protein